MSQPNECRRTQIFLSTRQYEATKAAEWQNKLADWLGTWLCATEHLRFKPNSKFIQLHRIARRGAVIPTKLLFLFPACRIMDGLRKASSSLICDAWRQRQRYQRCILTLGSFGWFGVWIFWIGSISLNRVLYHGQNQLSCQCLDA